MHDESKTLPPVMLAAQVKENIHRAQRIAQHHAKLMETEFLTRRDTTVGTFERLAGPDAELDAGQA